MQRSSSQTMGSPEKEGHLELQVSEGPGVSVGAFKVWVHDLADEFRSLGNLGAGLRPYCRMLNRL